MASAVISRWARRFLVVAVVALLLSQVGALLGIPRRAEVVLALQGFVLTVVFGKAYSLIPSYFDRTLAVPRAPAVHLPLHVLSVAALATAALGAGPSWLGQAGAAGWFAGTLIFVGTIAATVATNPIGRETGTSEANVERAPLDRLANPFVVVAVLYLFAGSYELLASRTLLPTLLDGSPIRISHLLAAGFALLLLFAVGYRLLPRFLVSTVPRWLALLTLPAGAVGPALLAIGYPAGAAFAAGAVLVSLAVAAFAVAYGWLFLSTDRSRVGFYGPLGGVAAGLVGVGLGLQFAFARIDPTLVGAHLRLNVLGLLGLSIAGVVYQFYPPAVGSWPGAGDRLAFWSLAGYAAGLALFALEPVTAPIVGAAGHVAVGSAGVALLYLLLATIRTRTARR